MTFGIVKNLDSGNSNLALKNDTHGLYNLEKDEHITVDYSKNYFEKNGQITPDEDIGFVHYRKNKIMVDLANYAKSWKTNKENPKDNSETIIDYQITQQKEKTMVNVIKHTAYDESAYKMNLESYFLNEGSSSLEEVDNKPRKDCFKFINMYYDYDNPSLSTYVLLCKRGDKIVIEINAFGQNNYSSENIGSIPNDVKDAKHESKMWKTLADQYHILFIDYGRFIIYQKSHSEFKVFVMKKNQISTRQIFYLDFKIEKMEYIDNTI